MSTTVAENKTVSSILFMTFICLFKISVFLLHSAIINAVIFIHFHQKLMKKMDKYNSINLFSEIRQIGFVKKQEGGIRGSNCKNGQHLFNGFFFIFFTFIIKSIYFTDRCAKGDYETLRKRSKFKSYANHLCIDNKNNF